MAGINAQQVYLPTPDQSTTTGAVAVAPVGTTKPTDARTALPAAWATGGYVGEAGMSLSINKSLVAIKDWAQLLVRKGLSEFEGRISFPFLQVDQFAAEQMLGADNVKATAATSSAGAKLELQIGASLPGVKAWCFSMKDENRRVRVYIPRGEITEIGTVNFLPTSANEWPVTLDCYDDGTGHSIYVMYDDGSVIAK